MKAKALLSSAIASADSKSRRKVERPPPAAASPAASAAAAAALGVRPMSAAARMAERHVCSRSLKLRRLSLVAAGSGALLAPLAIHFARSSSFTLGRLVGSGSSRDAISARASWEMPLGPFQHSSSKSHALALREGDEQ